MLPRLSSLQTFTPKFYTGSASRAHLPLLYDVVAGTKPRLIVTVGFGDGQAFFALCQAVRENGLDCRCVALPAPDRLEEIGDDSAWQLGTDEADEFYGDFAQLIAADLAEVAQSFADHSVDLLLLDDCDSKEGTKRVLAAWKEKINRQGITLIHGINLEREQSPREALLQMTTGFRTAEYCDGIGLGLLARNDAAATDTRLSRWFSSPDLHEQLQQTYGLLAGLIESRARQHSLEKENALLRARQVVCDTLRDELGRARETVDHFVRVSSHLEREREGFLRERSEAAILTKAQAEEIARLIQTARAAENASTRRDSSVGGQLLRGIRRVLTKK